MSTTLCVIIFYAITIPIVAALSLHNSHPYIRMAIVTATATICMYSLLRHAPWFVHFVLGVTSVTVGGVIAIAYDSVRARRNQGVMGDGARR